MSSDKDKRGGKLFGSRLASIFGDSDSHKHSNQDSHKHGLHVNLRTNTGPKSTQNQEQTSRSLKSPQSSNLLKQSLANASSNATSNPTVNGAKPHPSTTTASQTARYQTRSMLDPITPVKTPEPQVQPNPSTPISPQSTTSKLRRKPPPDLQIGSVSNQSSPRLSDSSGFDGFQFNMGPSGPSGPGSIDSDREKTSQTDANMDELINQIDNQLDTLAVGSGEYYGDSSHSNIPTSIPRSPNILSFSNYNSSPSPVNPLVKSSPPSPNSEREDFYENEIPSSSRGGTYNSIPKESTTPELQSPLRESERDSFLKFSEDSGLSSISQDSPKKDSFLNFGQINSLDSQDQFRQTTIKEFEGMSTNTLLSPTQYGSASSLNEDLLKYSPNYLDEQRSAFQRTNSDLGGFKTPEEYKLSRESSHDNPIIENQDMISPIPSVSGQSRDLPYPISTPEPESPISPQMSLDDSNDEFSRKEPIISARSSFDQLPRQSTDTFVDSIQTIPRKASTISSPSSRSIAYRPNPLKPVLSSPLEASISQGSRVHHRQSSSISSIFSTNSSRPVNLATIKKSLVLKPGEGERSNYVLTIRRSAGTAYNENGPGKWKLPIGIRPVDKNANAVNANGKYMRLAGPFSQNRLKKTSGVELKHGHLQPRLLAGEIDDGYSTGVRQKIGLTEEKSPVAADIKSSDSSIAASTLNRTTTGGSAATDANSIATSFSNTEGRKESVASSSGSISDGVVGGFYQHPGYKYSDNDANEDEDEDENDTEVENPTILGEKLDDYEERPKLMLTNPDVDSDSD